MDTTNLRADAPSDDSRAFDLAERVLDRLRAGQPADLSAECRDCPELLPQVRSLVEAAAGLEGLRVQMATGGGPPTGYQLVREIARGAMGVVYEARQLRLNRTVAFKMVLNADPSGLLRFLAEAEAVAAVRHPNVVQVYESGQHEGQPYLAMELCPGGTMAAKLKDGGRLAPKDAVGLMAAVAAGVAAAHAEGIVHRDLKPGNVLFDAAGVPKVADFGLAKRGIGADLTHTQAVMGTPAYMSPEQARGETKFVGPTADVWALGVMLYECLTGKRPFDGANQLELLEQVKSGVVAGVRSSQRDVPRDVELIVQKCLAKVPAERYATAAELAADLGNWLAGRPITAKPAGAITRAAKWVRRNKAVAASLAVAMLAMAVGAGVSLWQVGEARFQEKQAEAKAKELSVVLGEKTKAQEEIAAQLKRSLIAEEKANEETKKAQAALVKANERTKFLFDVYHDFVFSIQNKLENSPGTLELRKELLGVARVGLRKILDDARKLGNTDRTIMASHLKLGDVALDLGNTLLAQEEYEIGFDLCKRLAAANPTDVKAQTDLAISQQKLGDVALQRGRATEALVHFQKSCEVFEKLAAAGHTDVHAQVNLGTSYDRLGDAWFRLADSKRALHFIDRKLALYRRLTAADPTNAQAQRELAASQEKLGDVTLKLGQTTEALAHFQKSCEVFEKLAAADLKNMEAQRDLSISYERLGDVMLEQGQARDALTLFQKSLDVREKLAAVDPRNARAQRDLSYGYDRLGFVTLQLGQVKDALPFCQKGLDLCEKLAAADPENIEAQTILGRSYERLGDVMLELGQTRDALTLFQKSIDVREKLADAEPKNMEAQRALSVSLSKLGDAKLELDQEKEALNLFHKSLDLCEKLAAADPTNDKAQTDLFVCNWKLGSLEKDRENHADAIRWFEKGRAALLPLHEKKLLRGQFKEAVTKVEQAIATCKAELAKQKPREVAPRPRLVK